MKDLLRFDTIVAACALLMSAITAGAMVYQTRVLQDQFSATVWPYLSVSTNYSPQSVEVRLINDGVGPALIRSAQVVVDGKPMHGWAGALKAIFVHRIHANHMSVASVDSSTAIRPGDDLTLLRIETRPGALTQALKHNILLRFCYCSINAHCWNLVSSPGSNHPSIPVTAGACNRTSRIDASLSM